MRYAFLVAWREYAENVKTKGFWIGIFLFPLLIWLSLTAGSFIEKTKSVRHFVLVDQSGELEEAIQAATERMHQREVLSSFLEWAKRRAKSAESVAGEDDAASPGMTAEMARRTPAAELERMVEQQLEQLDEFIRMGGVPILMLAARMFLRDDAGEFVEPRRSVRQVPLPEGIAETLPPAELAEKLKPYLRGDESLAFEGGSVDLFAAVIVPEDILERTLRPGEKRQADDGGSARSGEKGVEYWSANLADEDLKDEIERAVNERVRSLEYEDKGVDALVVRSVERTRLPFAALNPKKQAGQETVSLSDKIRQWAPVGFVYLLWIAIFSISQMLLNNTIEEKSNRIIEVLLSSVTPGELMMGKLGGIAAVGLTMIGAWILSLVAILQLKAGQEAELAGELLKVLQSSGLLTSFVVYFLLGYLLYAGAFLAIGSLCNTLKEAQNMMGPIMVIMIVPLMTMAFIPKEPNGTLATVLSWIPLYTPFVMMNRAAADPPMFDRVGTMILLVISTIAMLWLSGRIFRIGILRTGQPPKFLELVRWVRGT
jgi:ABC-2 type transport system permease protein